MLRSWTRCLTGKKARIVVGAVALLIVAAGCTSEKSADNKVDNGLSSLTNDMRSGGLSRSIAVPGEASGLKVVTTYTTKYATGSWHITQPKTLTGVLKLDPATVPDGTIVYVEHMHADVSLKATKASIDGILQDSMDDATHGGNQPGFLVSDRYGYSSTFSIEGYSATLISGWEFQNGGSGAGEIKEQRLTEDNLRKKGGVQGNKITYIYDLLIQNKGDAGFHKASLEDSFLVPVG